MLVACRLAGLSALEAYYAGLDALPPGGPARRTAFLAVRAPPPPADPDFAVLARTGRVWRGLQAGRTSFSPHTASAAVRPDREAAAVPETGSNDEPTGKRLAVHAGQLALELGCVTVS